MKNYIFEYYQKIQDGSIIAGKWIKLWYSYIIKGLQQQAFFYNAKKASKAINFIEKFCHHVKGRSDLLKLELWEKAFISVIFGILDKNGNRQFREVLLFVARKNGKTLLAAAISAYMNYCDNEYGSEIYFIAPKLDQADICYSAVKKMIEQVSALDLITKSRKNDLYISKTNSYFKKIAFNEKKADGFNPHLTVADEIESWNGRKGLKQYEVMKSGMGARKQPMLLSLSTAGYENDGPYDELMKRATRLLLGNDCNKKETRLAPFIYMIDDESKWNDINEIAKANPNLGVSITVDYLLDELIVAEQSLNKQAEFKTKYCNIKQNNSQAWLESRFIEACFRQQKHLVEFKNCYCVGGIDLSQTTDLTACCIVIEKDGELNVFTQFFMPKERLEIAIARDNVPYDVYVKQGLLILSGENYVDYHDCEKWFYDLISKFKIYPLKVGYDRYSAQYLVQDMKASGFHMDDCYQGENMTPVLREAEGLIRDKSFNFGKNNLMKICLANSGVKMNSESNRMRLIKLGPNERIDGTAALIDALAVRQKFYSEIGRQLQNKR